MIHRQWEQKEPIRYITCVHTDAKKYTVKNALTVGKKYPLKNETDEFYFIVDNTGKIGGYEKTYFEGA
ncbi:DUF6501 family protein [Shouchella lonarensis]|uniref:Uncharacterized protein n=1 Tax=Shouchella lonarensis TaxID=1464122 RepID=A0A1G6J762_9BACI|nr:DUF6501 family protein [Shouchella lonarensis]SDC14185.1 hypothetical protein SAMN05421737_105266 [Shouchella lonarensis]